MWCHATEYVSRLHLCKYYSLWQYVETYFAEPDTTFVFKIFYEVFGGGTHLAMPKTIQRAGIIVIEAWFRGYWGSPGLGGPRTAGLYTSPDCWTMKIQDWRLRPMSGWDSPWRGRQARQYRYEYLLLWNRPCVTLTPSGVYINQRVLVRRTTYRTTIIP